MKSVRVFWFLAGAGCLAALGAALVQESGRATSPPNSKGRCTSVPQQVAELDCQIGHLSKRVASSNTELRDVRATNDEIAKTRADCLQTCSPGGRGEDCRSGCEGRTRAANKALENKENSLKQACRDWQQSITSLKEMRADAAAGCTVSLPAVPPPSACMQ